MAWYHRDYSLGALEVGHTKDMGNYQWLHTAQAFLEHRPDMVDSMVPAATLQGY